jgi:transposase InsO family protein
MRTSSDGSRTTPRPIRCRFHERPSDKAAEHLYRLEIRDVLELDAACEEYRRFYNDTRPHEAIGFDVPLSRYLVEPAWPPRKPHLSEGLTVQVS